jgi:DNA-binding CsgD family transcriptional regulator
MMIVTRGGRIRFRGQLAAHWLRRSGVNGKPRLPKALLLWIAGGAEEPFCWKVGGRNIFARVADHTRKGSHCLSLEEPGAMLESLTVREMAVLKWVSYGKTDEEIAGLEEMKFGTLKKCLKRIYDKLGVYNRAAAGSSYARLTAQRSD